MFFFKVLKLTITYLLTVAISNAQIVRINEFSQGASGNKEWVELVVTSSTPVTYVNCVLSKVSIAGWILDDNNGDFSPTNHFTGTGIAGGHMRFKNQAPWNNLPVGAIVLIYNSADRDLNIPADDPFDWVNNDCVYIVPSNHTSIEYCTTSPLASNCTSRTNYSTCTYGALGGWTTVGLANSGDAIQVRDPSLNLVHGIVYGKSTSASGCTTTPDMVGTALAPLVTNVAMSGTSAAFNGSLDADYFSAGSWIVQSHTLSTPAAPNNATNQNYIVNTLRGGCTCHRVLPLEEGSIIYYQRQQVGLEVRMLGSVLEVKGNDNYEYYVSVYNSIGKLLHTTRSRNKQLNLNSYLDPGINFIKISVDDRRGSTFIIKHLK